MATDMADERTRAEIEALIAGQDEGWAAGDAEAFAARALPDIAFTNILGMFIVGKEPFVAQHHHIFTTIYRGSRVEQRIERIKLLRADVAIVDAFAVLSGVQHLPPGVLPIDGAIHTRLEQVLVREEDGWWVAAFHNVAVNPAAAGVRPSQD